MSSTILAETRAFEQAQRNFDNPELRLGAIETIARLSLIGSQYQLRLWASEWLKKNTNVTVVQENGNATASAPEDIYR